MTNETGIPTIYHWQDLQTQFEGRYSRLSDEHRKLLLQDFANADCDVKEYARRIGGTKNLYSYAQTLEAQKRQNAKRN